MSSNRLILSPFLSLLLASPLLAEIKLPALVGDHMVLQCDQATRLWGWADAGETVGLGLTDLGGQEVDLGTTQAGADGAWAIELPAHPAGGPFRLRVTGASSAKSNVVVLEDVWFGELWIASGQSNMVFPLLRADCADRELAGAERQELRLFQVGMVASPVPLEDVKGSWEVSSLESARSFSAVAYLFGREVSESSGHVVGLIQSAWGGTPAEAWIPRQVLEEDPRWKNCLERKEKQPQYQPGALFNGMLQPLLRLRPRGVIWYQGEANVSRAYEYRALFPALIKAWREAFGLAQMPFLFVQLPGFKQAGPDPADSDWAELREAQALALDMPETGMAITIDVGDADDIHPTNKLAVGHRLALLARSLVYGENLVASGPLYRSMNVFRGKVELTFDHVGGGLVSLDRKSLRGFQIAGEDRVWKWARARIFGDLVVVWRMDTPEPVAVRYAWADDPACNLGNKSGLPAGPFRTDQWKGITQQD